MTLDGCLKVWACALALLAAFVAAAGDATADGYDSADGQIVYLQPAGSVDAILSADANEPTAAEPPSEEEIPLQNFDADDNYGTDNYDGFVEYFPDDYTWQVGPTGIIYRSYLAGPDQPRIGITPFYSGSQSLWDATVGGRGGVLRYGDHDPLHPHGWQLDVYGASIVRMDAEHRQDLNSADFVFGFPITYGVGDWQFKLGYAHLSSHLGDEYAIRNPGALDDRINYVRDGIVFGTSWFPRPYCRLYGEYDWAFHTSGGANPIHFQFGTELSHPGPTGLHGSPFLALNGRLREEVNYGGDLNSETGWLWRGETGSVFRIGAHYYVGKSSQQQFFNTFEEQIGMGLWYDF